MSIELVRITQINATLLNAVAAEVFDEPMVPERVTAYLANPDNLLILARADGLAIGMVMAVVHRHPDKPNELYIDEIAVTPDCQRKGVARHLMDSIISWGKELACEDGWLGTETSNVAARALYTKYSKGAEIMLYEWELD